MSGSAKFTAHGFEFARLGKLQLSLADRAGKNFYVIHRATEGKRMNSVSTGNSKVNRNPGWNQNAVGNEQVLLRDHAHGHRAIRVLLGSEIAFDKLSRKVQRQWIDAPRAFQISQQGNIDLVVARGWYQAQNQCGEQENSQLSPIHNLLSLRIGYAPISLSTALQRSQTVG